MLEHNLSDGEFSKAVREELLKGAIDIDRLLQFVDRFDKLLDEVVDYRFDAPSCGPAGSSLNDD